MIKQEMYKNDYWVAFPFIEKSKAYSRAAQIIILFNKFVIILVFI